MSEKYKRIVPFFYKWEGGLSKDPNDSASENMCPTPYKDGFKYHTNKGVTYLAWKSVFGSGNDTRFYQMNSDDWGLIFKRGYWDKVKCDLINSQSIAECLVSWAWGSGAKTAIKQMQRTIGFDKSQQDGLIGPATLKAINSCDEKELFEKCVKNRESFFRHIAENDSRNKKFLKGWLNRLEDFKKNFRPI